MRCTAPMNAPRPPPTIPARSRAYRSGTRRRGTHSSGPIGFAANTLDRNTLRRKHFMLQGIHGRRGLIDRPHKCQGARQNGRESRLVLDSSRRILMFHYQKGVGRRTAAAARGRRAGGPASRPSGSAGMPAGHDAQFRVARARTARSASSTRGPDRSAGAGTPIDPIAALHRLTSISPGGHSARIDDLSFDMESRNQERVALIFQVLKERPRVLAHQDGVRRVVMDAELLTHTVAFADPVQRDPGPGA